MSKAESADLIMKLYDLRREEVMREARNWIFTFNPTSAEEIAGTMMDPEVGPYLRMVTSYWDMAASFLNHGAIDAEMFNDITGEHVMVYAKIEPYLNDLREMFESPEMYKHLEKAIMDMPQGPEKVKKMQDGLASVGEEKTDEASADTASCMNPSRLPANSESAEPHQKSGFHNDHNQMTAADDKCSPTF